MMVTGQHIAKVRVTEEQRPKDIGQHRVMIKGQHRARVSVTWQHRARIRGGKELGLQGSIDL
eukprot:6458717-Ditylum_brightwellii.AAC.1